MTSHLSLTEWVNLPTKNKEGFAAIHFAAHHGNLKLVKLLIASGADPL